MKYKIYLILFLTIYFSCTKKENLKPTLRNELLNYQKLFPLPDKSDSLYPFYVVSLRKIKNDTILRISRTQVSNKEHYYHYGIFEDEQLKPTVIFDFDSLNKNLIKYYPKRKGDELLKTGRLESINPYYTYQLKQNEIFFLEEKNY